VNHHHLGERRFLEAPCFAPVEIGSRTLALRSTLWIVLGAGVIAGGLALLLA
jgi:hypothetical protein